MRNLPEHIKRLPAPVTDNWDWQMRGSCRKDEGLYELFYSPAGERPPARNRRETKAKAICQRCPILEECREHGLRVQEPEGIWGGLTKAERDRILKPRKKH